MRSFTAPAAPKTQRVLPPAEVHVARLYSIVDIGTHKQDGMFALDKNGNQRFKREIVLTWEFPEALHTFKEENGQEPFVVSKTYTFSLGDRANLRADLEAWRGKAFTDEEAASFDIASLVGMTCLITVGHDVAKNGLTYANIVCISKVPKSMDVPPAINPPVSYHIDDLVGGDYKRLPAWIQARIGGSEEFAAKGGAAKLLAEASAKPDAEDLLAASGLAPAKPAPTATPRQASPVASKPAARVKAAEPASGSPKELLEGFMAVNKLDFDHICDFLISQEWVEDGSEIQGIDDLPPEIISRLYRGRVGVLAEIKAQGGVQ